ncbi:MAG: 3-mercaptopyruvate sulfurtransferase [Rhodobacteraceae bacterium]|nr:3-mercaptopyruvate sulfurtransferase [Paracoccaceae bacterium]
MAQQEDPQVLVSTAWLEAHLHDSDLRVLDASWYLPEDVRDARAEYAAAHIPGARFFSIDDISDTASPLPHMVPPAEQFTTRLRALGVGDSHQVVVYDCMGLFSAARVWWLFRLMGKTRIAVLDGGLRKWRAEGRALEDVSPIIGYRHMTAQRQNHLVRDAAQVADAAQNGSCCIIDARAEARFAGKVEEPRPHLRKGHIPGSFNLPYTRLLNPDHTLKPPAALRTAFESAGVDLSKPAIATCGSGITAAILCLAMERFGKSDYALYDGSWAEWGANPTLPIATGDPTKCSPN